MIAWTLGLLLLVLPSSPAPGQDPAPAPGNATFRVVTGPEFRLGGRLLELPAPALGPEMNAAAQTRAFVELAGSTARAEELLRDSISAPFVLKLRDVPGADGAVVRMAHLVFAVHADLGAIDPEALQPAGGRAIEAGNMRFEGAAVAAPELTARGIESKPEAPDARHRVAFVHTRARLLDRIAVEATTRIEATWTDDALLVASRTDPAFDGPGPAPNLWQPVQDPAAMPGPYAGGAGYVQVGRYRERPGVLVVEARFAFVEPKGWFDGNPILRSKLSLIAQDQIRSLRRELRRPAADR